MKQRADRKTPAKKRMIVEHGKKGRADRADKKADKKADTLYPILFDFATTDDELILRCELPGVGDERHWLCVEPSRVKMCILQGSALQARMRDSSGKTCPGACLHVLDLPMKIDPSVTTATLDYDMLELRIPRAVAPS